MNKSCDEIKFWSGINCIVLIIKYLSQNFIKLSMLGMFWNPHDKQISNMSLIFEFADELTEIIDIEKDEDNMPK